jgi:staphylococcal nuclease domain-containing protein 1
LKSFRLASKSNGNIDEPGAYPGREWLRELVVGKMVEFETKKQGASAGDRVYGLLMFTPPGSAQAINIAVEAVRNGNATPKHTSAPDDNNGEDGDDYKKNLQLAYEEAKKAKAGIHSDAPLVRTLKNAGDDFQASDLVKNSQKLGDHGKIKCIIDYVFDGSRFRVHVTDPAMGDLQYASFTLFLAGVACPRLGNPRADPPTQPEEFAAAARQFVELRLLQRELEITLHGTDKSGSTAVGTIHHSKGNIAVELLKSGLAKISDWSVRMMSPLDVPALRIAETNAKRTRTGVWHSYAPPTLAGAAQISGTVVEVLTGDTLNILPDGQAYDSESKLIKVSLASVRAPRLGNSRTGRPDEPYCFECKDRLRVLTVGKPCIVQIHYEREIPIGDKPETRQFGSLSIKNKPDVAEVLISEGLATTQYHKDGDETSPRYDELRAAEAVAKAAKKGLHSDVENKRSAVNDLSDPKKAKAYSGSLMRTGKLKAIVDYCFNGSRFKMYIPSENCYIVFAPNSLRCPQPSPNPGSRQTKAGEPFGDSSKRHARLTVLQRAVEITCSGVSMGGVITGSIFVGKGGQYRDYSLELVGAGLATVDQRKIDYGEAPKQLVDAQAAAKQNRVGIWSIEQPSVVVQVKGKDKASEQVVSIRVSEIRSATHYFYHLVNDEAVKVIDKSMKVFTTTNGTAGAPCDAKVNKTVAALFDAGDGKSWYRAKIIEKLGTEKVKVVFFDHGNVAAVPVATHLRPLDASLGPDKIPPVAKEACLALTLARPLSDEYGVDAARMFQSLCWGKDVAARVHGIDESGNIATSIVTDSGETVNAKLVSAGLARVAKPAAAKIMASRVVDGSNILKLAAELNVAQDGARRSRAGMWQYGDIGEDDDEKM